MFTGIVREKGRVAAVEGGAGGVRLVVEAGTEAAIGDSVAIDGVCLTAVASPALAFDVVAETLSRTTLGSVQSGDAVNVEPALRAGDPLGGHIVQGHVDGVGEVRSVGEFTWIAAPDAVLRYCVHKGSIALDGVSLTVAAVDDAGFAVALVPHTREATTLGALAAGDLVNLEADVLAKYVERLTVRT